MGLIKKVIGQDQFCLVVHQSCQFLMKLNISHIENSYICKPKISRMMILICKLELKLKLDQMLENRSPICSETNLVKNNKLMSPSCNGMFLPTMESLMTTLFIEKLMEHSTTLRVTAVNSAVGQIHLDGLIVVQMTIKF